MENITTKYLTAAVNLGDISKEDLKYFKEKLNQYRNLINTKNFSEVYSKLLAFEKSWACGLFTLLCINNGINPFMYTDGTIPATSLNIAIKDVGASSIANKLSTFLNNLPLNTTIQGSTGCYEHFQFESITFNNIFAIYKYGLNLKGDIVKLNNSDNSIEIDSGGIYVNCNTLYIDAKYLDIHTNSIEGVVSDLYLNVRDILCEGISYDDFRDYTSLENFKVKRIFVSWQLAEKYSYDFLKKLFNCDEVGYI